MALDPIVSLSVALAEAPGTCAFFLGSGVSRDAGVPTGGEVRRQGLHRLRQVELGASDQVSDDELAEWLEESDHGDLSYSELLQLIAPDAAVRREHLAKYFEGVEPAQTHEALADLAVRGVVSVFVTTNFDRLLEHALLARGIEPVVVSSDAELAAAVPREHASCVVIKPHGDYLQQTIRNTSAELAELEPRMTQELAEVFERYGLVVLGYSGSDEGINEILKQRQSRYGLWWVARSAPNDALGAMIGGLGGRVVRRESAADFLTDLNGRLAVFEQHPSGQTPAVIHDQTLALLRAGDEVGLDELLRREHQMWDAGMASHIGQGRRVNPNDTAQVQRLWASLEPALERRLASLLPLVIHAPVQLEGAARRFAATAEDAPGGAGYGEWNELPALGATWVSYVLSAVALRVDRVEAIAPLICQRWIDHDKFTDRLVALEGDIYGPVGTAILQESGRRVVDPFWEAMIRKVESTAWLGERYPELVADGQPRSMFAHVDLLFCLGAGFSDFDATGCFQLERGSAERFARRLRSDDAFRARVAETLRVEPETFEAEAPHQLRKVRGYPHDPRNRDVDRIAKALEDPA